MGDMGRPMYPEQLPSVSQLLTPSPSSIPPSPYSPQSRTLSPHILRPSFPSSHAPLDRPTQPQLYHGHALPPISTYHPTAPSPYQQPLPWAEPLPPPRFDAPRAGPPAPPAQSHQNALQYHRGHLPLPLQQSPPPALSNPNFPSQLPPNPTTPHRIPRVVEERMIPGEGMCYIYEDGSHCRKNIDGEGVNPEWGVTKAGKPRKRLAQACITCREKKIKCDPSYPKCLQCQKFSRDCRFENA